MKQIPAEVTYEEGIYVGYRYYYNTFNIKPAYEFGYGLSYTNFTYSNLKLSSASFNGKITATIDITNTGTTAGKEIAELYISAPGKDMDKPEKELKAFGKTDLLQPGKKQTLSFTIDAASLASFDTKKSAWIAEPGTYAIKIGASSKNIKQTASFNLNKEIVVEKDHKVLYLQIDINKKLSDKKPGNFSKVSPEKLPGNYHSIRYYLYL